MPEPKTVNGVAQAPMEGVSMVYTFDDAKAAERHKTQYFEMFGNRAIYHDGWVAATVHKAPWEASPRRAARRGHLGALQRRRGLQRDQRPRQVESRQAQGAAGPVHDGSREVSRAADRRPLAGAVRSGDGGPARSDGRPQDAHRLRRHDRDDGERVHQRQEPVVHHHGRRRDSGRHRQRRDSRPGRTLRRLERLRQGRPSGFHLQPRRPE